MIDAKLTEFKQSLWDCKINDFISKIAYDFLVEENINDFSYHIIKKQGDGAYYFMNDVPYKQDLINNNTCDIINLYLPIKTKYKYYVTITFSSNQFETTCSIRSAFNRNFEMDTVFNQTKDLLNLQSIQEFFNLFITKYCKIQDEYNDSDSGVG